MKQLVCEMCGGTDLVKDGGVFICQTCGCKYTVEEAKKMMIEGTVDVTGTVQVDRSSEVENILKNADSTYSDGNYKEAFDLYSQAMNIEPDNPHAVLYRAISSAWQSTVKNCRIIEINKAADRAFKMQHTKYGDSKEYFEFCYDAMMKIAPLINAISSMYIRYYNKAKPKNYSITGAIATSGIAAEVKDTLHLGTKNCIVVTKNVITYVTRDVEDYSEADEGVWRVLKILANNCVTIRSNAAMGTDSDDQSYIKLVEKLSEGAIEAHKKKMDDKRAEYWASHVAEKSELDEKRAIAITIKAELEGELSSIPELSQKKDIESRISNLTTEMSSLGLFKGKEKKALQAQIDDIRKALAPIEKTLTEKKSAIQAKIDEQAAIISEVDAEFAKDR